MMHPDSKLLKEIQEAKEMLKSDNVNPSIPRDLLKMLKRKLKRAQATQCRG